MHQEDHNRVSGPRIASDVSCFRELIESNADAILIVGPDGMIRYTNPAGEALMGRSHGQLSGTPFGFPLTLHEPTELDILQPGSICRVAEMRMVETQWEGDRVFLASLRDISHRKRMEAELRINEAKFRGLFEKSPMGILAYDSQGALRDTNPACLNIFGVADLPEVGKWRLFEDPNLPEDAESRLRNGETVRFEARLEFEKIGEAYDIPSTRSGVAYLDVIIAPLDMDEDGCGQGFLAQVQDITSRKAMEEAVRESERQMLRNQKLESLGALTGGIAHDFNNLLMTILGNLDMAHEDVPVYSAPSHAIEQAIVAARRAAHLVRQMMIYAGQGLHRREPLNLNRRVWENLPLLKTSLSEQLFLNFYPDPGLPDISADPEQMDQVILNLVTNACEAIGNRMGIVSLTTGVDVCGEHDLEHSLIEEKPRPGRLVFMEVSDTGCGMSDETKRRLLEPFFTTKFMGRGLGMAAVMGIVRGHKGAILVHTEEGKGSKVRVLFPALDGV